ncbi:LXG domain-containing protein [Psychrobacillus sp. FJAT-51614]|uniref:LXG domain-containing protein n=1 Tax=Psychrobacillus mangrovi TaxID=3117745 RepID=A0ABU8F0W1_9BACI
MKVLDVDLFQDGLQRNITMLDRLRSEIEAIHRAVDGLVQMEDQLKGEGGNAIRSFYGECHLPFLQYFQLFSENFKQVLHQMEAALNSLEPDSAGHILEQFLEGELEQGLTLIGQLTASLTDETNSIMDQVSDIVGLPHLDDSGVQEGVINSKRKRDDTVTQLHEFDSSQTTALMPIEQDMQTMENWLADLERIFESGLTEIHFQTENWTGLTSKNKLKTDLVYRTTSIARLSTILDIESQMTTMLQTFLAGARPIQFGYGGFINIQSPFVGTDMIALSCPRPEGNGAEQEKVNVKKNSNILQDLADLGIGAISSIPSFFTGDFGSKMMGEAEKIAPRQSKIFENVQRFSHRTTNSALLGLPAQLEKNVTGVVSPFQSQRKFGEGGGTDILADMLGYLVPGVGTVKAIRGTALGAKGLTTGVSARNLVQFAKEGAAVGGVMSGVEVGGRELLNPEDTSWEQNALELGLNVGAGAALDPLVSMSVPIAKSVQKMLNDKSIVDAVNRSSKTDEGIPKGIGNKEVSGTNSTILDEQKINTKGGSKSPSEIAQSWQGSGKYPGVDKYKDIVIKKDKIIYRGEPNGTGYFTTISAIERSYKDATKIFEGLQVEKNAIHGYRGTMQGYKVNIDIDAAFGITKANPQFGKGELPQIFVPDVDELISNGYLVPVDTIILKK